MRHPQDMMIVIASITTKYGIMITTNNGETMNANGQNMIRNGETMQVIGIGKKGMLINGENGIVGIMKMEMEALMTLYAA